MKIKFSSIAIFLINIYLITEVFGGLILYILGWFGLESIFYLRDLSFIIIILLYLIIISQKLVIKKSDFFIFILLFIPFCWGIINLKNILLVLYGLKIILSLVAGYCLYYFLGDRVFTSSSKFLIALWIITVLGLLINHFVSFPWEAQTFNIGDIDIETSRSWNSYGTELKRLSGFTRGSSSAAVILAVFSIVFLQTLKLRITKILVIIVTIISILLTTMKGVFISYLSTIICLVFYDRLRKGIKYLPVLLFTIGGILPFLSEYLLNYFLTQNKLIFIILYSFLDRMFRVWPDAIHLILENGNIILGRGIGGIGLAQSFFETLKYNPSDNIFLYIWGNFGVIGIFFFYYILWTFIYIQPRNRNEMTFLFITLLFLFNGVTNAVISNAIYNVYMGVVVLFLLRKKSEKSISNNFNQK